MEYHSNASEIYTPHDVDKLVLLGVNKSGVATNETLDLNRSINRTIMMKQWKSNAPLSAELSITLYSIIFLISVVGNVLIILTLIKERRMRTVTNLFLINLAISDLLLSVLCMPFSLVAILLEDFIFGEAMCILIRYLQAVSVGVSCYTLVAISFERYCAICHPFVSRRWQTLSHARKMILGIWIVILAIMSPISAFHRVIRVRSGAHACREIWPESLLEYHMDKVYSVFLAVILLLVPLLLMSAFYGLIAKRLWLDISANSLQESPSAAKDSSDRLPDRPASLNRQYKNGLKEQSQSLVINSNRHSKDISSRKKVIRMLVVIVLQYFICWTPLYSLNTWQSIDFRAVFRNISPLAWSLILLLAYTSSFIHPITYCFMNRNFRQGFLTRFKCIKPASRNVSCAMTSVTVAD